MSISYEILLEILLYAQACGYLLIILEKTSDSEEHAKLQNMVCGKEDHQD